MLAVAHARALRDTVFYFAIACAYKVDELKQADRNKKIATLRIEAFASLMQQLTAQYATWIVPHQVPVADLPPAGTAADSGSSVAIGATTTSNHVSLARSPSAAATPSAIAIVPLPVPAARALSVPAARALSVPAARTVTL